MEPTRRDREEREVVVPVGSAELMGSLGLPAGAEGMVVFAHGSGSGRYSPRNRHVASVLRRSGLGTLLFDLLTPEEEAEDAVTAHLRFDIDLLATRLVGTVDWATRDPRTRTLALGIFGASTGAAAALVAAALRPGRVAAVVSRGGRPDLAGSYLPQVRAPTLLVVGALDLPVITLNEEALRHLRCPKRLEIVPGATHLFEEPGTLDEVAGLAAGWFRDHLDRAARAGTAGPI